MPTPSVSDRAGQGELPLPDPLLAEQLRRQLMAADPMQRALALHEIERASAHADQAHAALARAAERFAARGIPYAAPGDPHYQSWVGRAVDYWLRLREANAPGAAH